MSTLNSLNSEYVKLIEKIDCLQLYLEKVAADKSSLEQSLDYLKEMITKMDCSNDAQIVDTIAVTEAYICCVKMINEYKALLTKNAKINDSAVMKCVERIIAAQNEFDKLKGDFNQKYRYVMNSDKAIKNAIPACISGVMAAIQINSDEIKKEAKLIIENELSVELHKSDAINNPTELPESMMVARVPVGSASLPILKDIGIANSYQNIQIDLRRQGNTLIQASYEQMEAEEIDNFIISYVFRYIESFPLGTVNVHIFDQNTNFLYKRLVNCFQTENASESLKLVVQIHTSLDDLKAFRDVQCEDIFKKTTPDRPDLFAIYESDRSDVFNLIILRDGLVDGSGYANTDNLDAICSLTKIGDMGHRCGLRFLIVDNSESFDKNLNQSNKHLINLIYQNCNLRFSFMNSCFYCNEKIVETLGIDGDADSFIQHRAKILAEMIEKQEKGTVTLDDISLRNKDEELSNILYIPVGKAGNTTIELPLSCKDEDGTAAGKCIGYMAIGQSGSGKSSFFHSLVLNGCTKYSPRDLQFWLLDFKNGGASSKYRNSGLPHIKIIAENNKIDDALCLFQMILEEIERRSKAFNKQFTDNIVDYNKKAKDEGLEYFPRIIIAIDEVQEIFREDNAAILQTQISSIVQRMRFAGIHFIMVAQNLCEGKSYMLKDAFLPSATGRICFRVMQDIPRDSGFEEEFIDRKQEISQLNAGEAYVSYGKDTIKKVKMAFISPQDMSDKYFIDLREKYSDFSNMKPLVIGSKNRLGICTKIQGTQTEFIEAICGIKPSNGRYLAVVGEDAYRMIPLNISFTHDENSSVFIMGSDKRIASSLCMSVAASLLRQNVEIHLFNGDRTKVQENDETIAHAFMYFCQNVDTSNDLVFNHKPSQLPEVLKSLYEEFLRRQSISQKSDDEDPEFPAVFLIINDLFGIEAFESNVIIESKDEEKTPCSNGNTDFGFDYDIFSDAATGTSNKDGQYRETIQNVMSILIKSGYRYNIHIVLALKGTSSSWRMSNVMNDVNRMIMFNNTEQTDLVENSYYLREMLRNISNDGEQETMAVWHSRRNFSKMRPILYSLNDPAELVSMERLVKGD